MTGRVGLFGGTFDPVHNAHVALARLAVEHLALDELRWIPAGRPWQKSGRALAGDAHRVAMLRMAIEGDPRFVLDERELHREGPSYTIDSVLELQRERPDAELFLVIGEDQYVRLPTWHRWRELLAHVTLAVAPRDGEHLAPSDEIAALVHRRIALPAMPVSATDIRERIARGQPVDALVPPDVARYIERNRLYAN